MRRVSSEQNDIFRPRGQLAKELALASEQPASVVEILKEKLSEERCKRIEDVISHRTRKLAVAIEGVRDPHNTAAVIRTADAFGIQLVHVIERGDRFLSSRKVTQGSHKWVDLAFASGAEDFATRVKSEGKRIYVADADATATLEEIDPAKPAVFVFGNEHDGVSDEMRAVADDTFAIPMCGFPGSINVSAAAAVTMFYLRRDAKGDLSDEDKAVLTARYYLRAVRAGYDIVQLEMGKL